MKTQSLVIVIMLPLILFIHLNVVIAQAPEPTISDFQVNENSLISNALHVVSSITTDDSGSFFISCRKMTFLRRLC